MSVHHITRFEQDLPLGVHNSGALVRRSLAADPSMAPCYWRLNWFIKMLNLARVPATGDAPAACRMEL